MIEPDAEVCEMCQQVLAPGEGIIVQRMSFWRRTTTGEVIDLPNGPEFFAHERCWNNIDAPPSLDQK